MGKTVAQWRRDVPTFDRAFRMVEGMRVVWPNKQMPPVEVDIDPDTLTVSIVLDGTDVDCDLADQWLTSCGYEPGWVCDGDSADGRAVWRKTVTR